MGVEPFLSTGDEVILRVLQLLRPPLRETVDEYVAEHRLLPARTGTGTMRWYHEEAPYLVAPMRDVTAYEHTTVAVVGPGQAGKTSIAEGALLHAVARLPRNILWYMQTDEGVEAYVKSRINPMIEMHTDMMSRIGRRAEDNAQHFKRFAGMWVQFLSATYSNLISKSAPVIIADEWDAYVESLGDPKGLLDIRRQYYGRASMLLAMSHPDRARGLDPNKDWQQGIMRLYADSTRGIWYWPCPHCGTFSSPAPIAPRMMTLEWPREGTLDEIERGAHLLCPVNGCVIEDRHRRQMNLRGKWVGQGQTISDDGEVGGALTPNSIAGYWIVGVMSPFLLSGIGGLARNLVKAERELEISGDAQTLKEVTVKQLGIPYTNRGVIGSVDAQVLAERAETEIQPLDVVPEGVRFLTCWIDIQLAHFEILVRGWGVGAESWVVAKSRVPADTSTDRQAWYDLLSGLANKRFPLATDAGRGMGIRAIGYDSGGAPGVSERAYEVWRRLKDEGLARSYGESSGRHVWSILPTKGRGNPDTTRLAVVYPDNQKKDKKITRNRASVPLALFNASSFKDDLAGQLMHAEPGPGYIHIPRALRSPEPPHVVFEQLVSERRDMAGRWSKPHQGVRNEMLDLMVGCHVLAWLHGLGTLKWESPKIWAAEWDHNSMIETLTPNNGAPSNKTQRVKTIFDLLGDR